MNKPRILVIDDQIGVEGPDRDGFLKQVGFHATGPRSNARDYPCEFVFHAGCDTTGNNSLDSVIETVLGDWPDPRTGDHWALVLLDVRFGRDPVFGFTLLQALRAHPSLGRDLPVVMLTSEDRSKREMAGRLVADGFLPKFDETEGRPLLSREALFAKLLDHGLIPDLRAEPARLIGRSLPFLKVLRRCRGYARKGQGERGGVVLYGESGTGKSELAAYIHYYGPFSKGPFIQWFADPANTELMKDELFGHWQGAHSEAKTHQAGKIESAHGGTFFLDEVANLPREVQQAFLKLRKEDEAGCRSITRLGKFPTKGFEVSSGRESVIEGAKLDPATHDIRVRVDLLTATNANLEDPAVREARGFLHDLHNALGQPTYCPGLNERRDDVPELFRRFVARARGNLAAEFQVDPEVWAILAKRDWSHRGNIRDLERIARQAANQLQEFDTIHPHGLPSDVLEDAVSKGASPGLLPASAAATHAPLHRPPATPAPDPNSAGALSRADLAHMRQRIDLLTYFAEETRRPDLATGQPGRYQPTAIVSRMLGATVSPLNAKRVIGTILKDVLDTSSYLAPAYQQAGLDELRMWVSQTPLLQQLYRYSKGEIKADEIGISLHEQPR